jgi:hypothetical protein
MKFPHTENARQNGSRANQQGKPDQLLRNFGKSEYLPSKFPFNSPEKRKKRYTTTITRGDSFPNLFPFLPLTHYQRIMYLILVIKQFIQNFSTRIFLPAMPPKNKKQFRQRQSKPFLCAEGGKQGLNLLTIPV